MWLVRLCSTLVLATALLLPPGLLRDCCCTRRAALAQSQPIPLRSCCRAASKSQTVKLPSRGVRTKPGLRAVSDDHLCQCRVQAALVAIEQQQRIKVSSPEPFQFFRELSEDGYLAPVMNSTDCGLCLRHLTHQPPVRIVLGRWLV